MRRFVIAVSLAHLFLLPAYVKLGAIRPWQAVESMFGRSPLWVVMMFSATCAPVVLGGVLWVAEIVLRRLSDRMESAREIIFIYLGLIGFLAVVNAFVFADADPLGQRRYAAYGFVAGHASVLTGLTVSFVLGLGVVCVKIPEIRQRLVACLSAMLMIVAPSAILSVAGMCYLLARTGPLEHSGRPAQGASELSVGAGLPPQVIILLFDS